MPTSTTNTTPSFIYTPRTGTVNLDAGTFNSLALQGDGKAVLGGSSYASSGNDFSVVRLNADGSLDTSFSGDGQAVFDVGGYDGATSVVVQSDSKVVLGGYSGTSGDDFGVAKLNADGSLDTSFSSDGKAVIAVGSATDYVHSVVVQSDGKLVLGGYSGSSGSYDFSVVRLNADGSLDTSFSGDGQAVIDLGGYDDIARSVVMQPDGKLVLGGTSVNSSGSNDFSVLRLNADGSLDTGFGSGGKVVIDLGGIQKDDAATCMVMQSDGKLVLAGYSVNSSGSNDFSVVRLNADGSLDTSFSGDGKTVIDLGGDYDQFNSVVVQPDGKLVLAGSLGDVVRLNADGSLDTTFDGDGITAVASGIHTVKVLADGKIVLGSGGSVTRLNTDGSLDTTFGVLSDSANSLGDSVAYTENAAPVILDSSVVITDTELAALNSGAGNYAGSIITLARAGGANAQDVFSGSGALSLTGSSAVLSGTTVGSVSNSGGTLTITFNAAATRAVVNQTLSSIAYSNTSDAPPASVQIDWTFNDGNSSNAQGSGGALSTTGSTTVNITATNDTPTGGVTITGTAQQGQILTASHTLTDADGMGSISYQWLRGGSAISGATDSSYTVAAADLGHSLTVQASYIDGGGTAESVTGVTNSTPSFTYTPLTGTASLDMGTAYSLTLQSDGKLVLGGYSYSSDSNSDDFSAVRLNADGSLDTSFSNDGKAVFDLGLYNDYATSVVTQSDGKLVLGGYGYSGSGNDFSVVRLNTDGSLDTSFRGDGKSMIDVGGDDEANSVVVQSDGKVVLAGRSVNSSGGNDFSVVRLNADGSLDTSFSGDGKVVIDLSSYDDIAKSAVVQTNGKVVLAGYSLSSSGSNDFSVVRLNADGSLDTSFSGDGQTVIDVGGDDFATNVVVQSDGKLVLGGYSINSGSADFSVVRLNADGSLDTSFGSSGQAVIDLGDYDQATSVVVQPDGKLVLAGSTGVVRLNSNGSLDTTFSGDGISTVATGIHTVKVLADGKLMLGSDSSVTRLNADGSADTTFGAAASGGIGANSLGGNVAYTENATPVILDSTVVVRDPDLAALNSGSGNYAGSSITLARTGGANAQDVFSGSGNLSFSGGSVVLSETTVGTVAHSGGTLTLTFNAAATQARVNETLSSIAYANTSATPPASVQIAWIFSDGNAGTQGSGGALSATGTTTVNITAVDNTVTGTSGPDTLNGTANADTLSGLGGNDTLNGGSGVDTASYADATTPVSVILNGGQAFGVSSGNDTLTAIENILGTAYSDLIYGDAADNVLDGGAGNDTLDGALGNDTLLGQTGDDLLNGLAGNDSLDGGDGNDSLYGWADNDNLAGGTGTDRLFGGAGADRLDGGTDADQLEGDDGADTLLGGAGNDTLRGWNDNDSLDGGDGDNALFGGAGADSMQAGTGADQLEGDDGNDTIAGGAGNDTLRGWNDNDSLDGGDGNDALFGGAGADAMMGGTGADQLEGDDGNDTITGGTGNDTLRGWNDSDSLDGGDGNDLVVGWSGNDSLMGGLGDDQLFGDDGADTLVGSAGGDVLQGGLGNDLYTFATGFGFDGVKDYDYTAGNSDTFQFTGINRADLSFARVGDALKVERTASAGADVIYVNDWYQAGSNGAFKIETWVMGDASVFTAAQIEALV